MQRSISFDRSQGLTPPASAHFLLLGDKRTVGPRRGSELEAKRYNGQMPAKRAARRLCRVALRNSRSDRSSSTGSILSGASFSTSTRSSPIPRNGGVRSRPRSARAKDQPFYHLYAENADSQYVAYVSEQNLMSDESGEPVRHPQVSEIFERTQDGRYCVRGRSLAELKKRSASSNIRRACEALFRGKPRLPSARRRGARVASRERPEPRARRSGGSSGAAGAAEPRWRRERRRCSAAARGFPLLFGPLLELLLQLLALLLAAAWGRSACRRTTDRNPSAGC